MTLAVIRFEIALEQRLADSELKSSQFSLRSMIVFSTVSGIVLAISIPLVAASKHDGLYFAPYHLFGDAFFPLAVLLFILSPFLLITIGVLLYFRQPRPNFVYIFLVFIALAILQAIASRPYVSDLYKFAQIISPAIVVLSIASIAEAVFRKLESHYVTTGLTFPIGLAYWFITSGIVSAV